MESVQSKKNYTQRVTHHSWKNCL